MLLAPSYVTPLFWLICWKAEKQHCHGTLALFVVLYYCFVSSKALVLDGAHPRLHFIVYSRECWNQEAGMASKAGVIALFLVTRPDCIELHLLTAGTPPVAIYNVK